VSIGWADFRVSRAVERLKVAGVQRRSGSLLMNPTPRSSWSACPRNNLRITIFAITFDRSNCANAFWRTGDDHAAALPNHAHFGVRSRQQLDFVPRNVHR